MPRRALFLVHGVGSQKKGEFLRDVLNPLLRFLDANFKDQDGHSTVRRKVLLRPDEGPAHAEIDFGDEHWEVWEVHWADAFYAERAPQVILWGWRAGVMNVANFLVGSAPFLRALKKDGGRSRPAPDPVYPHGSDASWQARLGAFLYDFPVGIAFALVFLLAYVPVLLLASLFYVLALLPSWLLFPVLLRRVVVGLVDYILAGFGDQYAMMYTHASMEAIKGRLMRQMARYFDARQPELDMVDSAAVIAHSGGATLSFAALSDPNVWQAWTGADGPPVRVAFFTVGSSLNIAAESVPDHPMWSHPLPESVAWLDVWSRYDPVPHGPASTWLADHVRGSSGYYRSVRVTNLDSIFSDHDSYWGNHEEVVSRFLYETTRTSDTAAPPADVLAAVQDALAFVPEHRRRISLKTALVLMASIGTIVAATASGLPTRLGQAALSLLTDFFNSTEAGRNAWLVWETYGPDVARFVLGASVLGAGFFIPWQFLSIAIGPRTSRGRALLSLFSVFFLLAAATLVALLHLRLDGVAGLGRLIQSGIERFAPLPEYPLGLLVIVLGLYALWSLVYLWVLSPFYYQDPWKRRGK